MITISNMVKVETIFSGFERTYGSDFKFAGERHNFWEFLYVIEGCMNVAVDDKIYELSSEKMIFYSPMAFHSIWSAHGTCPKIIIISFLLSGTGFEELSRGVFSVGNKEKALIYEALDAIKHCNAFENKIKNQLIANKIEALILNLLETQTPQNIQKRTIGTENYKMIINVMNDNVYNNLSCEQIAEKCNLSVANLKKIFKKYSGISVMKYFNHLRILKAIDLIGTGKTMAEISNILNFSSQRYFTEAFKRQCGITPTEHKKSYINNPSLY